jgi:hypothetical protein
MDFTLLDSKNLKNLIEENSFKPLLKVLIENKFKTDCEIIKCKLDFFRQINFENLTDNSTYVCFNNLKDMYFKNEIPSNVFWISCFGINEDRTFSELMNFVSEIKTLKEKLNENKFQLNQEWLIEHEGYSGLFLIFNKGISEPKYFNAFFIAIKTPPEVVDLMSLIKK